MKAEEINPLIEKIINLQDENGCWNVLDEHYKNYPELTYYVPKYKSTLWTLILLADMKCDPNLIELKKPLEIITNHFFDEKNKIYSIGKSHFPIPCLNGNMIYLHSYFGGNYTGMDSKVIEFFNQYQRFDDGGYKTPKDFPYYRNKSCYGGHSCYWGIVKLFKGLSFIPKENRSKDAVELIDKCIDFILLHQVCFSSRDPSKLLHPGIKKLAFPEMYGSDYLEILWILQREGIASEKMNKAIELLKAAQTEDYKWKADRKINNLTINIKPSILNEFITERAIFALEGGK